MGNRLVAGILALLLVLCGLLGFYSYTLNEDIDLLSAQTAAWQQEQVNQLNAINASLAAIQQETRDRLSSLEAELGDTGDRVSALEGILDETLGRVGSLESNLAEAASRIDTLAGEAANTSAELSRLALASIDAPEVYQAASQSTVRVTNGDSTIGSGFIFDDDAHVVTAYHVIDNLTKIYVVLPDGSTSRASVAGSCEYSDIAVLRLADKPEVPPLPLADSDEIRIGEAVVAIGNPYELTETLTAGVVSQVNRFVEIEGSTSSRWIANLVQFDAPANAGNSGCPLLNAKGEVAGLVIARINPTEGDGINYAVAANKIKRVATTLIERGFFDYPWLGINMVDLTPYTAQARGLDTVNGMVVTSFATPSPAQSAGMQTNDIIIAMDGIAMRDAADLTAYLGEHKSPDDTATFTVIRGDDELEITVMIGERLP